jgi:hypothetical protein
MNYFADSPERKLWKKQGRRQFCRTVSIQAAIEGPIFNVAVTDEEKSQMDDFEPASHGTANLTPHAPKIYPSQSLGEATGLANDELMRSVLREHFIMLPVGKDFPF